jgi:toxin-antitoxin system PIN domain toxin
MILPDVNVLVHAYNTGAGTHPRARAWWENALSQPEPVALTWVVILGYVRIMTNPRAVLRPIRVADAAKDVRAWLACPQVTVIHPTEKHAGLFFGFITALGKAANLSTDAHLAALSLEYQARIASTDTDFARFKGVRWFNPLD